jgi:hypothetical protein
MPEAAFCHRHHHHHSDKDAILVVQQFPTAMANRENDPPDAEQHWWISDDTGAVLSEEFVAYPTEADAWESAYLISVLGRSVHDIQVAAYFDWENAGRPEGEDLEFWLDGKSSLETPLAPSTE